MTIRTTNRGKSSVIEKVAVELFRNLVFPFLGFSHYVDKFFGFISSMICSYYHVYIIFRNKSRLKLKWKNDTCMKQPLWGF